MSLVSALAAFSLLAQQGAPSQPSGLVVEGKQVSLTFPAVTPAAPSADVLGWRGWAYLNGAPGKVSPGYLAGYDWSKIQAAYEASKGAASPALWRTRFVIFERTETDFRDPSGVLRFDRRWTPDKYLGLAQESIARLAAWVTAETGGKARLVPEITVEHEFERADDFGPAFAQRYFGPRINGGGYEAEDKVFRGPYHSAIYILPGVGTGPTAPTWVNGTPIVGVPTWQLGTPYVPGELDVRLHDALVSQMGQRLAQRGLRLGAGAEASAEGWAEATNLTEVPTATLLQRIPAPGEVSLGLGSVVPTPVSTWKHEFHVLSLVADNEKGQVLHVVENGAGRNSGVMLPERTDGQPLAKVADTPTLSLSVKSTAEDAIGITIFGNDHRKAYVTLGREPNFRQEPAPATEVSIPFKNDGTWQRIAIDLRPLAAAAGFDSVVGMAIEPAPLSVLRDRRIAAPIEADFDDIRFTSDAPTAPLGAPQPDAKSTDPEERALFAAKATAGSPELVALLTDKSDLVRLNAADAYTRIKDDQAQTALVSAAMSIDPTLGATALRALVFQGGDAATATVRRLVGSGMTPYTRETAARLLAATKDPRYGNDFKILMTDHSRLARIAAVESLAAIPSKENSILQMAFLAQEDPEITLAVTNSADVTDEYQMRKLLWSAVNEPSDLVRAASDIKLISSPNPSFRAEGYKGVRDDSRVTRIAVLDYLAAHPDEAHRGALRLAVTDRSPEVRAAALRGFAALEKGAAADEIANVLEDRHPLVQLALIDLAKRRGFKLSDTTRNLMAGSPDERVRTALKELPG
jgi:HEAT repeat protein